MAESIINIQDNQYTDRSPCIGCEREYEDKNECILTCPKLSAYQAGLNWKEKKEKTVKVTEKIEIEDRNLVCKISGCNKSVSRRGLCQKHYDAWRRSAIDIPELGTFKTVITKIKKPDICLIDGCDDFEKIRGLCSEHYKKWRKGHVEHPIQGKFSTTQTHVKSRIEKVAVKKVCVDPPIVLPIAEIEKLKRKRTGDIKLTLCKYPKIWNQIFEIVAESRLPVRHVIMTLLSEAIMAREKNGVK